MAFEGTCVSRCCTGCQESSFLTFLDQKDRQNIGECVGIPKILISNVDIDG